MIEDDIEMTVVAVEFHKLGYRTEAELHIEPQRRRYFGIFWLGEERRKVAWEPSEPERQRSGVKWAFRNPAAAILDLMKIDIDRRQAAARKSAGRADRESMG